MTKIAFTCDLKGLRAVTSQALRTMSSRGVVQVLSGIQLTATKSRLTAVTTDMEVGQRIRMKLTGATPGTALVAAKKLDTLLSTLDDGDVTVKQVSADHVEVSHGTVKVLLESLVAADYPTVPDVDKKAKPVVVMAEPFKRAYEFVRIAASRDQSRPVLTSVCLEPGDDRLFMCATDSYRMAWTWGDATCSEDTLLDDTGKQRLVYPSALDEVARLLKDDLSFVEIRPISGTRWLAFTVGDIDVLGRSVEGAFPQWRQLIPDAWEEHMEFDRQTLHKSLSRIVKLTGTQSLARFGFFQAKGQDDELRLVNREQDSHELVYTIQVKPLLDAPKSGRKPMELGINATFAKEAVGAFSTDNITMCIINPLRPSMFRADRDDEGFLVMPVRLV